ncbi:MAG: fasciclin domain-containing protein [Bacteroidota bacterium]
MCTLAACSEAPDRDLAPGLAGAIELNPEYSVFVELATDTGLQAMLEAGGPYTVLGPTDIAFKYVGAEAFPVLASLEQRPLLARVLRHHVIEGRMEPEDFVDGMVLTSLEGEPLRVQRVSNEVVIEGATIDLDDASVADNGVVYPASNVIRTNLTVRERIELSPTFATFARFAAETGLLEEAAALEQRTALIPIEDVFAQMQATTDLLDKSENVDVLAKVVRPHILPGLVDVADLEDGTELATLGGDTVTLSRQGAVVFVDGRRVLSRGYDTADGRIYLYGGMLFKGLTLAERLRVLPQVTIFPGRIQEEADIWARMNDPDDALTVFVPRDAVYIRQNADVQAALALPENAALLQRTRRVLVAEGRIDPDDLINGLVLQALDGTPLPVLRNGDDISVGGQRVRPSGTAVNNGAVYTLESFIPPEVDPFDTAILRGLTIFSQTVRRTGLESQIRTESLSMFAPTNRLFRVASELSRHPNLREILLYQMTRERLPFKPDLDPPVQPFTVLTGDERALARYFDPDLLRYVGPVLIEGFLEIPEAMDSYDGRSRIFFADEGLRTQYGRFPQSGLGREL